MANATVSSFRLKGLEKCLCFIVASAKLVCSEVTEHNRRTKAHGDPGPPEIRKDQGEELALWQRRAFLTETPAVNCPE